MENSKDCSDTKNNLKLRSHSKGPKWLIFPVQLMSVKKSKNFRKLFKAWLEKINKGLENYKLFVVKSLMKLKSKTILKMQEKIKDCKTNTIIL